MNRRGLSAVILVGLAFVLGWRHYSDCALRSRVAEVWLDHRRLSRGLLDYQLENGDYPPSLPGALATLTTPLAFLSRLPRDSFQRDGDRLYRYRNETEDASSPRPPWVQFSLVGIGPDGLWSPPGAPLDYDPSNGILSSGDILTLGPQDATYPRTVWSAPIKMSPREPGQVSKGE